MFSKHATGVQLLFFDRVDAAQPARVDRSRPADPSLVSLLARVRARHHARSASTRYRVDGPFDPEHGHRFDRDKVLLDPYGGAWRGPPGWSRAAATRAGRQLRLGLEERGRRPECVRLGGRPPAAHAIRIERSFTRCTSAHFTRHPNSGVAAPRRGTYAGVVDKIPYLQDLGVTAVELLAGVRLRRPGCAATA